MYKNLALVAMAMVSVSAFAQSGNSTWTPTTSSWNKMDDMDSNPSFYDMQKKVVWHANKCLSGGDSYTLLTTFDRVPLSVQRALVGGLYDAHKQAKTINEQMLAYRFPAETTTTTSATTTDGSTATTTTTTTTVTDNGTNNWSAMDWSNGDMSSRPMRMVMTKGTKPKDISYSEAIDILIANQGQSTQGILSDWWQHRASERQKDVIVRLLEDDASMVDQIYYPSVYTHRTYSWITTTNN